MKLQGEVVKLLQLTSMELEVSRNNFEWAQKKKQKLVDQLRIVKILLESIQAFLMEEKEKTKALKVEDRRHKLIPYFDFTIESAYDLEQLIDLA